MTTHDYDAQRAERDAERRAQMIETAQCLDAELSVLTMYDTERRALRYDYGNGQRFRELIRVRRARDFAVADAHAYGYAMGLGDLNASPQQCLDAWRRLSTERLRRYGREAHRTETAQLALEAWRRVAEEIGRAAEAARALGL